MFSKTLLIGPKGQITLPKKIRDIFGSKSVHIDLIDDNQAIISPVSDVGGALSEYAKRDQISFDKIREKAWKESRNIK